MPFKVARCVDAPSLDGDCPHLRFGCREHVHGLRQPIAREGTADEIRARDRILLDEMALLEGRK